MTSGNTSFPTRLTEVDELTREDHSYLTADDRCFFLGDYSARAGFNYSPTNQLIWNFKIPMERRGSNQWHYKTKAIATAAQALQQAITEPGLKATTLIPVPPSKVRIDPLYDDRIVKMLQLMNPNNNLDIREMVIQTASTEAAHNTTNRPTVAIMEALYEVQRPLCTPCHDVIGIVDDVLTTGCHFKAIKNILTLIYPHALIVGIFLARRVPLPAEIEFDIVLPTT